MTASCIYIRTIVVLLGHCSYELPYANLPLGLFLTLRLVMADNCIYKNIPSHVAKGNSIHLHIISNYVLPKFSHHQTQIKNTLYHLFICSMLKNIVTD